MTIGLAQNHGGWNSDDLMTNNLGRFRISATGDPDARADPTPILVRQALAVPRERRSPEQVETIFSYWRTLVPEWKAENDRIEALWKGHPAGATTLVLQARDEMRPTAILKRGDFLKPGKAVAPGVPRFLNQLPSDAPPNRLTFAKWLVDPQSPTTARAFVNRAWQSYFGTGLVATSEDLGTQADAPSHPELLDWLAVEFMDKGWKVKDLHRLIVGSATYRQSSKATPELLAKDPYNRLLARGARLRVEGEVIRDIQLAASGLLNPTLGGPSAMPPAPAFLFQPPASYAPFPWIEAKGPDRYRRGVYTLAEAVDPLSLALDLRRARREHLVRPPGPLEHAAPGPRHPERDNRRRGRPSPGPQGPRRRGRSDADRLAYAFRRCVGRKPAESETAVLLKLLDDQRRHFGEGWASPWEIVTGSKTEKPGDLPKGASPTNWAAYTVVARVLLNLDETITKE